MVFTVLREEHRARLHVASNFFFQFKRSSVLRRTSARTCSSSWSMAVDGRDAGPGPSESRPAKMKIGQCSGASPSVSQPRRRGDYRTNLAAVEREELSPTQLVFARERPQGNSSLREKEEIACVVLFSPQRLSSP
jgi:hypothetical protein